MALQAATEQSLPMLVLVYLFTHVNTKNCVSELVVIHTVWNEGKITCYCKLTEIV